MEVRHGIQGWKSYGFQIEYHFVWVTKYRYKVLSGDVVERIRELVGLPVRETCEAFEIRIIKEVVSKDHVHILASCPPTMAPSEIMRRIKGRTSSKLFEEFPHLKKKSLIPTSDCKQPFIPACSYRGPSGKIATRAAHRSGAL